ncbi:MAG: Rrf2 family transcriptional regulator [Cyanobacteria bacterium]|nr:Rrf2 family transcriptional regulator [Cyanobacteriota bacterium]
MASLMASGPPSPLLGRQMVHALKALLELAEDSSPRWRSVASLAASQALPAPMLEQLLLRLRRSGLLEARRGRVGGYRLARGAPLISLAEVVAALERPAGARDRCDVPASATAADRVAQLVERRLRAALEREMGQCSLADLQYDLRSAQAVLSDTGGMLLG